jgi:hypothetical protein
VTKLALQVNPTESTITNKIRTYLGALEGYLKNLVWMK